MTRRCAGFVLVCLGVSTAACGEVAPSSSSKPLSGAAYEGGSRLRAVLAEASDGTASFFHWWDADLGVQCQFEPVASAEAAFRCRPSSGPVIYEGADDVFGDAECSRPIVSDGVLPPGGSRVVRRLTGQCYRPEYFRAGAPFTGAATYRKTDAGCVPGGVPTKGEVTYSTLEALPDTAFVAGQDASVPATAEVAIGQIVADDGSVATNGLRDGRGGNFRCWPRQTASGVRCLPVDFGWGDRGGFFSDAGCRVPAAVAQSTCGDGRGYLPYVFTEDGASGGGVVSVHAGGAGLPDVFQQVGAGECAAAFADIVAYEMGELLPLEGFLAATLSQVERPSGLVQTVAEADGVSVARFGDLSASALGGYACELAATPNGAVHCVPPIQYTQAEYADPACTDVIWQSNARHVSVASDRRTIGVDGTDGVSLPIIERVLVGGTAYDGPVYAQRGGECTRVDGVPNSRQPYQRFEREASLAELPQLEIVVR